LQIVNIPIPPGDVSRSDIDDEGTNETERPSPLHIEYDAEWLAILRKTHNLTQLTRSFVNVPADITPATEEEIEEVRTRLTERHRQRSSDNTDATGRSALAIPDNFCITVPPHGSPSSDFAPNRGAMVGNPQTDELLDLLGLEHIVTVPYKRGSSNLQVRPPPAPPPPPIVQSTPDENEIDLEEEEDEDEEGEMEKQDAGGCDHKYQEPKIDDNEIDVEEDGEEEEDQEDQDGEEDVQTKKARTGSIEK